MILSLANVFPLFYAPLFMSEYVFAVLWYFHERICFRCFMVLSRAKMFTLFFCYFRRANVFALFMVFSRANMFTLFYVIFSRANVFTLFMVLLRANVFSLCLRCLWCLHERICLRCLGYFSRANVLTLFMVLSRANMFIMLLFIFFLKQMCLRWVICSFLLANMFSLFMGVADTLRMVMAVTIIITLVGVSTPLGVIIVVKLGTELPIVPHLSVRNIVFLDRLIQ